MTIKFNKVKMENIEGGKAVDLVNRYLSTTAKELLEMGQEHDIDPRKLKGQVKITLTIQPLGDSEEHYAVGSAVSRVMPKITNQSMAIMEEGGLFVQERGSDKNSPLQTTIENFTEQEIEEGDIDDGNGNIVNTKTGEVKSKQA